MDQHTSNDVSIFRFTPTEVSEMQAILQEHQNKMPVRSILESLAEKFSESADRKGKIIVQLKQVRNWFQNRLYSIRAKSKFPQRLNIRSMPLNDSNTERNVPQPSTAPMPPPVTAPVSAAMPASTDSESHVSESSIDFEAKSSRDGAWYDVATFSALRSLDTDNPEVLVRFANFGPEEDEWVDIPKHVRQRSIPCEASECIIILPQDSILCFQESCDHALYFDAYVLDVQRRRHDARGCRCRFLVRFDHDLSEEIVPLWKICRMPETDYRLQQLSASSKSTTTAQRNPDLPGTTPVSDVNISVAVQATNPESNIKAVPRAMTTNLCIPLISSSEDGQNMQKEK